jgi:hypothetical protein
VISKNSARHNRLAASSCEAIEDAMRELDDMIGQLRKPLTLALFSL